MAEWLIEHGIGEDRAALIEDGRIVEAALEWDSGARLGAVLPARLLGRRGGGGMVRLDGGEDATLDPVPPGLAEGATLTVEIVREAIPEPGRTRPPRARPSDDLPRPAPTLAERIGPARTLRTYQPDALEAAGWSELLAEAADGEIAFPGGALRLSVTPAMTLFDVDGTLPPAALAVAGAAAAARAIRRMDIGGSIGLDLPTLPDRAARQAAAAEIDRLLPQPFERTAVNGFGFLQIVRRRLRPSLPERLRGDAAGAAARALLRQAERGGGHGERTLAAHPAVIAAIRPEWTAELARRIGAPVALRADPALAISAGHVAARTP